MTSTLQGEEREQTKREGVKNNRKIRQKTPKHTHIPFPPVTKKNSKVMFAEVLRKRKEKIEKIDARPSTLNSTDDDFTKMNAKKY